MQVYTNQLVHTVHYPLLHTHILYVCTLSTTRIIIKQHYSVVFDITLHRHSKLRKLNTVHAFSSYNAKACTAHYTLHHTYDVVHQKQHHSTIYPAIEPQSLPNTPFSTHLTHYTTQYKLVWHCTMLICRFDVK